MNAINLEEKKALLNKALNKQKDKKIIIALDGSSASGKGTLGKNLAKRFGYAFLDTGALYRAVALALIEMGGDVSNINNVIDAVTIVKRHLTPELLDNVAIRKHEISEIASQVAAIPEVRKELLDYQREFASNPPGNVGGAVLDGRDIGTVVCPDADFKFFIEASIEERARRRFNEVKLSNKKISFEQVLEDIKIRDERDRERNIAPTKQAEGAYVLDTTSKSPDESMEEVVSFITAKMLEEVNI